MVRLFIYGTLRRGEAAHGLLGDARFVGEALTAPAYALFAFPDWPALVPGGDGAVAGEVYEVDAETLAALDAYEDCPDLYVRRPIRLADGSPAEAYLLSPAQVAGLPVIPSGDWKRRSPPAGSDAGERQLVGVARGVR